ncbi:hypothetical protein [Actinorugispora endophytica]|uniref:Uncharacterized protein n=1 Tax=Actinorugispora endophytica TaxID=1605990 RepID=A0A4R6V8J9_9ACTN|nr:hypothetical protein [Actinorugispora endophytica]TDQ55496.1 hypothetical protein EV190_101827 [Actinorugispora endophytica]
MSQKQDAAPREFAPVTLRLSTEFEGVHPRSTVARCVAAARHGALDVTGRATPDLVERIARQHLKVLALAFAEQR